MKLFSREPALILGLVTALLALAIAFGLDLSPSQQGSITALVIAIMAVVTRTQVAPVDSITEEPPSL